MTVYVDDARLPYQSKRALAVAAGAVEVTQRDLAARRRALREQAMQAARGEAC